jgi:uncharacterized membrane protein YbhN (UPF0104 family)
MTGSLYRGGLGPMLSGKSLIKVIPRAVVSICILLLLFWWLPTKSFLNAIQSISFPVWFFVFSGYLFGHVLSAFKWRLLLHTVHVKINPLEALKAHSLGLFANLCLPSVVGGDFIRAGVVVQRHGQLIPITLSSLADRLNDTFALILITTVAGLSIPHSLEMDVGPWVNILASTLLVGILSVVVFIRYIPFSMLPTYWVEKISKVRTALSSLSAAPHIAFATFMLSVLIQSGFIMLNVLIAEAIGIAISVYIWFFAWPLAKLIALIPVSLGGIGVREVALSAILVPFGVEVAPVVAQGLSWQAVLIFSGLFAGIMGSTLLERDVKK